MTRIIHLVETTSTNQFLKGNASHLSSCQEKTFTTSSEESITVVVADYQTAGKGQGTNTWESEKGKNLLFSILVHPTTLPIERQYILSEAAALSYKEVLDAYTEDISVKWPNDIYWQDRKVSGTLIETSLSKGVFKDFIIGTGINVNQKEFRSDAPNPVSLCQITGREIPLEEVQDRMVEKFEEYYQMVIDGAYDTISKRYHEALYRKEGLFPYRDRNGEFTASIDHVKDNGHLVLKDTDGNAREYAFKEVQFVMRNA
jgi:BirA family biotin operon repressor/biotin-[acetyl-CoA-carboxylase] ligase